jgi:hypothetical protein
MERRKGLYCTMFQEVGLQYSKCEKKEDKYSNHMKRRRKKC